MTNAFMVPQSNPTPPRRSGAPAGAPAQRAASAWRRALPTLATFALVALFAAAAVWQHARMQSKEALAARLAAASRVAAVALPHPDDWAGWRYRRVALAGRYDAPRQILIDNRIDAGRVGFHVVTPFLLDDGRAVLVDRGFIAAGASRAQLPAVPVPAGQRVVRGRIELPGRYVELDHATPSGNLWQNLDPARFAAVTGIDVLPIVVEQDAADAPGDGLARDWPPPDLGAERNYSYMLQWIAFALVALGLWTWFVVLRK
ncbi:MAG TPA: SURF1 family protein [Casimicrobiaceae bacterium]|nr:SURF1 family protein [Casimicrobiaceae bacterium]